MVRCSKHNVEMKYYWHRWDSLVVQHGVMYRKWENDYGTETELQMIVPRRLRNLILTQMHDSVTAGHLGVKKTLLRVRHRFSGMDSEETWKSGATNVKL